MADFVPDTDIWPVMGVLVACGVEQLALRGLDPADYAYVQPGGLPVTDYVGNGKNCSELIVNLNNGFPVDAFPIPAQDACGNEFAYEIAIGLFRCAPPMRGTRNAPLPPTLDEQIAATEKFTADMAAMKQAVLCCMQRTNRQYVMRTFQGYGPSGNVVGGVWTVLVGGEK